MLSLKIYPKSSYISTFNENESFYYTNTLLVGNSVSNDATYISLLKFNEDFNLDNINIIDAYLNLYLINGYETSLNDIQQNLILCKITEDFNIEEVSWNNQPKAITINLDKCDYSYNLYSNTISFNISSIFNNILESKNLIYGLAIICRPTFKSLYKFYSSNSYNSPFININYTECENEKIQKLEMIFKEDYFNIQSTESEFYSNPINIANLKNATYFIKNLSDTTIYVYLEISPDEINFTNDVVESCINSGESVALSLGKFLKFSRIKFLNKSSNPNSDIQIWFQGQTFDYYINK